MQTEFPAPTQSGTAHIPAGYPSQQTRAARRRRQNERERALARRAGDKRQAALDYAQQLLFMLDNAPDEQARRDLRRMINKLHLRFSTDEHKQRLAVLRVLESRAVLTCAEIVALTSLPAELVQQFLDEWTSAAVDLVYITTTDTGKRRCGRAGTKIYYGLRH
jgi:hypothetical protein